jgi:glycosyltransferase involved in cell wall biosynthesis
LTSEKSISVLIANFNWDVSALIKEIHGQLTSAKVPFEILCYDNSKDSVCDNENQKLNDLENVTYRVEHHHIGRSQNRNKLAQDAKLDWFLFLDGDSSIPNSNFIDKYLTTSKSAMVVCGGTAYAEKPSDKNLLLRWTYGKEREEISAEKRNENSNSGFSSFNFLIKREAFELIGFNNALTQYGHEDTLFGQDLKKHHFNVLHINNPLVHLGLDEN